MSSLDCANLRLELLNWRGSDGKESVLSTININSSDVIRFVNCRSVWITIGCCGGASDILLDGKYANNK